MLVSIQYHNVVWSGGDSQVAKSKEEGATRWRKIAAVDLQQVKNEAENMMEIWQFMSCINVRVTSDLYGVIIIIEVLKSHVSDEETVYNLCELDVCYVTTYLKFPSFLMWYFKLFMERTTVRVRAALSQRVISSIWIYLVELVRTSVVGWDHFNLDFR